MCCYCCCCVAVLVAARWIGLCFVRFARCRPDIDIIRRVEPQPVAQVFVSSGLLYYRMSSTRTRTWIVLNKYYTEVCIASVVV